MPLLLDPDEVTDLVDRAAELRGALALGRRVDLAEPERAQRLARLRVGAVLRLVLGDLQRRHQPLASATASAVWPSACSLSGPAAAASESPSPASGAESAWPLGPRVPSTSPIDRPRSLATSS